MTRFYPLFLILIAVLAIEIYLCSWLTDGLPAYRRWRHSSDANMQLPAPPMQSQKTSKVSPTAPVCGYLSCPPLDRSKLNVHMVPHTHDDVGWLKTVEQYYYGGNTSIQRAGVQYIIDSVVRELLQHPSRRFVYVETAYLWKWWQEQDEKTREQVRGLVNAGQLEIIGGAWSMNDEAVTHYQSIIDQFTWGLRILNDTFGECARPRVGWQIDPFGHSQEMASLFAQMGYDGLFFARLHFQDKYSRLSSRTLEMIWKGSPDNLGPVADLFTHVLYNHYDPPAGFCFDILCRDEPMINNKQSPEYNIPSKVKQFMNFVEMQASYYPSPNIILTMGQDFHYQDANVWYKNMDKLIKYVNAEQQNGSAINVLYSTPSCYLKAVHEANLEWKEKKGDFFPYATNFKQYWTGYFTSKPTIKYFERLGNNFLQVGKQVAALARTSEEENRGVTALREAMGVMQHHDAITGTMRDHVAQDYSRLLHHAIEQCGNTVQTALSKMMEANGDGQIKFTWCLRLNISDCVMSEHSETFVVTVWNPLSRPLSHYVRLPVLGTKYTIFDPRSSEVPSELVLVHELVQNVSERRSTSQYDLLFQAEDLPPIGYKSYYISQKQPSSAASTSKVSQHTGTAIGNQRIRLEVDEHGLTKSIHINGIDVAVKQSFRYYTTTATYPSGAYIFRPAGGSKDIPIKEFKVYKGAEVEEVHQVFGDGWVSQVIRVYKDENHVEFEWMVGPIPDGTDKEVISVFHTDLKSKPTFYTDSNGRELLKRVTDFWSKGLNGIYDPISSNYYPVTSKILIRDEAKRQEVAVLVDRAQGGSSIKDGQIELMLHRRLYHDDGYGVDEALNERAFGTGLVARGKHFLTAGPLTGISPSLAVQERQLAQRKLLTPWVFLSPTELLYSEWVYRYNMEYRGVLEDSLPSHVHILSLEPWKKNRLLLRLENILEKSDDPQLAATATVNLHELFSLLPIVLVDVKETTLAGNQWLEESERLRWNSKSQSSVHRPRREELKPKAVTLDPMQIRTFVITYTTM